MPFPFTFIHCILPGLLPFYHNNNQPSKLGNRAGWRICEALPVEVVFRGKCKPHVDWCRVWCQPASNLSGRSVRCNLLRQPLAAPGRRHTYYMGSVLSIRLILYVFYEISCMMIKLCFWSEFKDNWYQVRLILGNTTHTQVDMCLKVKMYERFKNKLALIL